jgi:hypothetical protein
MPIDYEVMEVTLKMDAIQFEAVQTVLQAFVTGVEGDVSLDEPVPERNIDYVDTIKTLDFTFANPTSPWNTEEIQRLATVTLNVFLGIKQDGEETGTFSDMEWDIGNFYEEYVHEAVARYIAERKQ